MFASLDDVKSALLGLDQGIDVAERIDRIRQFEELESALAAARAREVAAFAASQRTSQLARGMAADRVARGIGAQVGLARRISPFAASRYVRQVQTLITDLPNTYAQLAAGNVSEARALLVAREAGWLSAEHRRALDARLAPELEPLGTRRLVDRVRQLAYQLDPHGYLIRISQAEKDRHVSLRPAPECMVRLSALLPVAQGVAAYAALRANAVARVGVGDETRGIGQLMADAVVERLTGQRAASAVPISVSLVMTDQSLLNYGAGRNEPAHITGGGVIPAELARRLLEDRSNADTQTWIRRLYTSPTSGSLIAMESQSRCFTPAQKRFLSTRDQSCRTPWCDAPIRHADHVVEAADHGPTSVANGQGLCEACNYIKTTEGWTQYRRGNHIVAITPTGHLYRSTEPRVPGQRSSECSVSEAA